MRPTLDAALTADFETYVSDGYSLTKMSARAYITDPRFKILSVALAVATGPIMFFYAGAGQQTHSLEAARSILVDAASRGLRFVSHNTGFDGLVAKLAWGVTFPSYFDTIGYARALGIGASLANVAAYYGYRKLEPPAFTEESLQDPGTLAEFARYNAADTALARRVYGAAIEDPGYPDAEFEVNDLTVRMNLGGLRIDTEHAGNLAVAVARMHAEALAALASGYAFNTSDLRRHDAVREFAKHTWGLELGSLDKRDADLRQTLRGCPDAEVFFRLRDRIYALSRAIQKLQSYAAIPGGRVYSFLRYYGAHTGRFSAGGRDPDKFNVHQLYKTKNRLRIPELGAERGVIVPEEGRSLVAADLATVEARVVAWLADERTLLEQFSAGTDVYIWFVAPLFPTVMIVKGGENDHLRQLGKETILGLGFGMGFDTFLDKVREVMPAADADIVRALFDAYHASFPQIRRMRYTLMAAFAKAAVEHVPSTVARCSFHMSSEPEGLSPTVVVTLPSGRALYYRSVLVESEMNSRGPRPVFWYAPHANLTGEPARARGKGERLCTDGQRRVRMTPQMIVENVVQSIARDVMVHQVLELERRGLHAAFHTHDEEVFECPACVCPSGSPHVADCPWSRACALVESVMSSVPETLLPALEGLPLKAEAKLEVRNRYGG